MKILKLYQRNFRKNKSIHIITIGGFAVSLALFLVIISYVVHEKSFDQSYPEIKRMYRIVRDDSEVNVSLESGINLNAKLPLRARDNIIQASAEIEKLCFYNFNKYWFKYNHQNYSAILLKTDDDFFDVFSIKFVKGNRKGALVSRDNIIVTESFTKKHFGKSEALGQQLIFGDEEIKTVVAVVADPPKNSCIEFEAIVNQENSMFNYRECYNNDCYFMYNTALLLHPKANNLYVNEKINPALKEYEPYAQSKLTLQKFDEIYFDTATRDVNKHANVKFIKLLTIVAFVILILSAFNYINLSVASNFERFKEVCIRKTSGAKSGNIIRQFIIESYLSCFISLTIAFILIFLFSPFFSEILNLEFDVKEVLFHPYLLLFSVLLIATLGWTVGYLPAKIVSSYQPVELVQRKSRKLKTGWTGVLNIIQYIAAIVLISGLLVINKQLEYLKTKKLGFHTDHLLFISLNQKLVNKSETIKSRLLQIPSVTGASASQGSPFNVWNISSENFYANGQELYIKNVSQLTVDNSFLETLDISLVDGRNFRETDKNVCLINESLFKSMEITNIKDIEIFGCKVIGVFSDIHYDDLHQPIGNLQLKYGVENPYLGILNIRIRNENIPETLSAIESAMKEFDNENQFNPKFYDEMINDYLRHEENQARAIKLFALIAIFLSCLGLYGKMELSCLSRTKEIGIHKVNGARVVEVITLLNKNFLIWMGLAMLIAVPIGYTLMKKWLENFAYRTELSWWVFTLAGIITLIVTILTVIWKSYMAAIKNPVEALRYE